MTDIVEQLRAGPNGKHDPLIWGEMLEAANEIERLRAVLERIDAINDNPARYNSQIDDAIRVALEKKA